MALYRVDVLRLPALVTVAAVAIAAGAAVVGITLATRQQPPQPQPQAGKPPIAKTLDTPAAPAIRKAFADWPHGSLAEMLKLQLAYPNDPVVQFYVGLAYAWAGYDSEAVAPLERAKKFGRNTPIEVSADSLLHPEYVPGDPTFQLSPGSDALLRRGAVLEQAGHRQSAERLYVRNAKLHAGDPEALAAAAFGLFDKDNPSLAFSKLGPVATRFPRSQSVHFNLGYLLVWIGQTKAALAQFEETQKLDPNTTFGRNASRFIAAIRKPGTTEAAK
jgi:tetratricopeptide (TPR) repeat protein